MSKSNLIVLKRVIISIMVILWAILIFKIYKSGGTFNEQLPKCIFTTMGIFGILIAIVTQIDKKINSKS